MKFMNDRNSVLFLSRLYFFTSKCLYQHIAYHYVLETDKHTHHAEQNFRSTKNYNITDWHDGLYSEINKSEWSNGKTSCRFCEDFSNTSFLYGYNPIKIICLSLFFQKFEFYNGFCTAWTDAFSGADIN